MFKFFFSKIFGNNHFLKWLLLKNNFVANFIPWVFFGGGFQLPSLPCLRPWYSISDKQNKSGESSLFDKIQLRFPPHWWQIFLILKFFFCIFKTILDELYSCRFGTFLYNNERERAELVIDRFFFKLLFDLICDFCRKSSGKRSPFGLLCWTIVPSLLIRNMILT